MKRIIIGICVILLLVGTGVYATNHLVPVEGDIVVNNNGGPEITVVFTNPGEMDPVTLVAFQIVVPLAVVVLLAIRSAKALRGTA